MFSGLCRKPFKLSSNQTKAIWWRTSISYQHVWDGQICYFKPLLFLSLNSTLPERLHDGIYVTDNEILSLSIYARDPLWEFTVKDVHFHFHRVFKGTIDTMVIDERPWFKVLPLIRLQLKTEYYERGNYENCVYNIFVRGIGVWQKGITNINGQSKLLYLRSMLIIPM